VLITPHWTLKWELMPVDDAFDADADADADANANANG
jgi:hypothetical protein